MSVSRPPRLAACARLALVALALAACAAPASVPPTSTPPTAVPTQPTTTAPLPTPQATLQHGVVSRNDHVLATSIAFQQPNDIAFDTAGNMYVAACDFSGPQVYKVDPSGLLTIYAGRMYSNTVSGDGGPALSAGINCAVGLAFDSDGNLYVSDSLNNRIRRIDRDGIITTVAGTGTGSNDPGGYGGDGGPATAAQLKDPTMIAFDPAGNLYIADEFNNRIRKVDRQGIITTVAGNGTAGFSGDAGPATAAELNLVTYAANNYETPGIAIDAQGQLYIADCNNNRVRKVDQAGIITTIAGNGGDTVGGDGGPAISATLSSPNGLTFDAQGNLYIAAGDSQNVFGDSIRKVDRQGIITTIAGVHWADYSGDGGPALAATINEPAGIRFDAQGNLYIADFKNNRVRKVDTNGIITTVVGGHVQ
jgi:sugar lactone lactonase YvrE